MDRTTATFKKRLIDVGRSFRKIVILVNPGHDLDDVKRAIEGMVASSPNAVEFMGKYRSKDARDTVDQIKVRWSGRDSQIFPKETLLTEDNCEAALRMMAIGSGQDVFDVKLNAQKTEQGAERSS